VKGWLVANSYSDANGVYRNKLGITDAAQLKRTEYHMAGMRSDEILSKRVDLGVQGFGLARQQAIHGSLRHQRYSWRAS
jgi:cell filamentation protein